MAPASESDDTRICGGDAERRKQRRSTLGAPELAALSELLQNYPRMPRHRCPHSGQRLFQMLEGAPRTNGLPDFRLHGQRRTLRTEGFEVRTQPFRDGIRRRVPSYIYSAQSLGLLHDQGIQIDHQVLGFAVSADFNADRRDDASIGLCGGGPRLWRTANTFRLVRFPMLRLVLPAAIPHLLATPTLRSRLLGANGAKVLNMPTN
mmetsp:Transcript_47116/g.131462  ORF Transcript_47116/g.131462 Transcript_47116/m.131462 type:complete len:205 (+) Transcript_47116:722-1336(+)